MTQKKQIYFSFAIRITFLLQIALTPAAVFCGQVTLSLDKKIEPDFAGYKIFCREENSSYNYNQPSWQGAEARCVIQGLDENEIYYAVARTYNTAGIESRNSNEVNSQPCHTYPILSESFFYKIVIEGETVILDYVDNLEKEYTIVKYRWEQIEGIPVVLSDPTAVVPTFTVPSVSENSSELRFLVEVRTAENLCDTAEISIMIENDSYREVGSADSGGSGDCFISRVLSYHF